MWGLDPLLGVGSRKMSVDDRRGFRAELGHREANRMGRQLLRHRTLRRFRCRTRIQRFLLFWDLPSRHGPIHHELFVTCGFFDSVGHGKGFLDDLAFFAVLWQLRAMMCHNLDMRHRWCLNRHKGKKTGMRAWLGN
jgi:hypothetical protein